MQNNKLVILDRDGVINQDSPNYIRSADEWSPLPGSLEAIAHLNAAGFTVVVATNQSGIGRGYFSHAVVDEIHQKMQEALKQVGGCIDHVFLCPHHPDDDCECRKPKPGMVKQIESHYGVEMQQVKSPFVGDSLRDLQAAKAGGCTLMLVKTGNGIKTLNESTQEALEGVEVFDDLLAVSRALC